MTVLARQTQDANRGLHVHHLAMQYAGGYDAVRCVDLDITDGERYCLVGGVDSGKTALCKTLCGIESATYGSILLDGVDITAAHPRVRNMAMTFGRESFRAGQSLRKQLHAVVSMHGLDAAQMQERMNMLAKAFGLQDVLDIPTRKLDDAQIAAAALLRVCLRPVRVRLIDDPARDCAQDVRERLYGILSEIVQKDDAICLFTARNLQDCMCMRPTQIGVLWQGVSVQSVQVGTSYQKGVEQMLPNGVSKQPAPKSKSTQEIGAQSAQSCGTQQNIALQSSQVAEILSNVPEHYASAIVAGGTEDAARLIRQDGQWLCLWDNGETCVADPPPVCSYEDCTVILVRRSDQTLIPYYFDAASGYRLGGLSIRSHT